MKSVRLSLRDQLLFNFGPLRVQRIDDLARCAAVFRVGKSEQFCNRQRLYRAVGSLVQSLQSSPEIA